MANSAYARGEKLYFKYGIFILKLKNDLAIKYAIELEFCCEMKCFIHQTYSMMTILKIAGPIDLLKLIQNQTYYLLYPN